jgi:hypothetical protein
LDAQSPGESPVTAEHYVPENEREIALNLPDDEVVAGAQILVDGQRWTLTGGDLR